MSGDHGEFSFGDPNGRPPTPRETPKSAIFPSPVFSTPRDVQGHFAESSGWTPRFAEEYSVFNATPGNLRGVQGPFPDFANSTPHLSSGGQKRPLSAGGIAAEIASHVNHFSQDPNQPLPPVDPARRLLSLPGPLEPAVDESAGIQTEQEESHERSAKRARRGTIVEERAGQTVTPPPSARKGQPKLAPKPEGDKMQNEQGYGQPDFMTTPQQPGVATFATTPTDMFGYPLSAPATAPAFTYQRPFWDSESSMAGMDVDYSAAGAGIFQTPNPGHRPMDSLDWGRDNQMFQDSGLLPLQNQENAQTAPPAPSMEHKVPMTSLDMASVDQSMFVGVYPSTLDDPFGIVGNVGGVNPGLLFSQPPTSSIEAAVLDPSTLPPSSSAPPALPAKQLPQLAPAKAKGPARTEPRRSSSVKEIRPNIKEPERTAFEASPTKPSGRPGLSRSFSESRGKKPVLRAAMPAITPAPRLQGPLSNNAGVSANRPSVPAGNRSTGRTSPLKSQNHHRLSSLSSIPEGLGPRTRRQAKFTIDANGRARVDTTVIVDEVELLSSARKRHSAQASNRREKWNSSEEDEYDDDDASSTDDEPIIIPSRNTSFALPDPRKPTTKHPFHSSQRSFSERGPSSSFNSQPGGSPDDGGDSDAETVLKEAITPTGGKAGDAASELRKLRDSRQKRQPGSTTKPKRTFMPVAPPLSTTGVYHQPQPRHTSSAISPTTLTDTSLPTPSTESSRSHGIRCTCNRPEVDRDGDGFMVQCESCEMWLHGRCVNISKRTLPSVYICAFCANTPNMRGGRIRDNGRVLMPAAAPIGHSGSGPSATSPLAHKSFKFR